MLSCIFLRLGVRGDPNSRIAFAAFWQHPGLPRMVDRLLFDKKLIFLGEIYRPIGE